MDPWTPESLCAWRQESTDRCRAIQLMDRRLVSRHPPARRPPGVACMHMHVNMACIDRWPQIWPNCGLHMSKPRSCIVISYRSRRWPSGRIGAAEQIDQGRYGDTTPLSLSLCLLAPHATVRPSGSRSGSVSPLPCRAACACQLPSICARCLCRRRPRAQAIHVRMLGAAAGTYTAARPRTYVRL
jgi:hypothetical protein